MTGPFQGKALIVVGDAAETLDTLYPYYRLIEAGIQPVVTGPERRRYQMVMHEVKPGWTITKEWEGYTIDVDVPFSAVKEEEYLGIMFSGGRAPRSTCRPNRSAFTGSSKARRRAAASRNGAGSSTGWA